MSTIEIASIIILEKIVENSSKIAQEIIKNDTLLDRLNNLLENKS